MCTFRPPKDKTNDSRLVPYTGGCARINLLSDGGHAYINLTRYDQLLELPFPGPSFQTARIWMIGALALNIFGGGIILAGVSNWLRSKWERNYQRASLNTIFKTLVSEKSKRSSEVDSCIICLVHINCFANIIMSFGEIMFWEFHCSWYSWLYR